MRLPHGNTGDGGNIAGVVMPVLPGALLVWAAIAVWAFAVGSGTAWAVLAGVSVVIGAGIFTVTGRAAQQYAGPSVILSFILAA